MISKINIWPIVTGHLRTLYDRSGEKIIWQDVVGFYVLPLVLATFLVCKKIIFRDKYVDIGIVAHTIFIPLLANVLFLIFNIMDRGHVQNMPKLKRLLNQLYDNVAYLILMSVISLAALAIYSVESIPEWLIWADRWVLYAITIHIFFTTLMVVKRIHVLLSTELQQND